MAIGKVGRNGTLNENGAFYSVQDVNTLLENAGGADLPEPTAEDAGKAVVVGDDGKYALGEGGSGGTDFFIVNITYNFDTSNYTADKTFAEIVSAVKSNKIIIYSVNSSVTFANNIRANLGGTINSIGGTVVYIIDGGGADAVLQAAEYTINSDNTIVESSFTSS